MPARTILVVDDDPDIRRIAALSLERLGGFRVLLASGAEQALEEVARALPDLVLLDVSMPGMDGPAALTALKATPSTANVPVIFFTATASEEDAVRLRALGALAVVAKPFDVATLPARIRDILAKAGLE